MYFSLSRQFAFASVILGFCSLASANLITVDDATFGAGSMIRDTAQGLDFLKLNKTEGLTTGYVNTQFGVGGQFQGLRFATNQEVATLVNDWGFSPGAKAGISVDGNTQTDQLSGFLTLLGGSNTPGFGCPTEVGLTATNTVAFINYWNYYTLPHVLDLNQASFLG